MFSEQGQYYEQMAIEFLRQKGYAILQTNWRWKQWEIDIIAEKDGWLIFVEVKGRSHNTFGKPYEFIDKRKKNALLMAAKTYIDQNNITTDVRFDAISILKNQNGSYSIEHLENIFLL